MEAKNLLKEYGLKPSKGLGQHFLIGQGVLKKIIQTAGLKTTDVVLEIGPGLGILTRELAKMVKKVIAVEKDQRLCRILERELKNFKNLKIIQDDILKSNIQYPISNIQYKIVANLPYYITSPVIRKFLEMQNQPKLMVLMVQKEVAQRICSKPPRMSLLAVAVQFYAKPEIVSYVSKNCFWPEPKVDSAIIKITPINANKNANPRKFFKIVRAGFSHPRKQLINNFSQGLKIEKKEIKKWLQKNKINPKQRAETLNIKDWMRLTKTIENYE